MGILSHVDYLQKELDARNVKISELINRITELEEEIGQLKIKNDELAELADLEEERENKSFTDNPH